MRFLANENFPLQSFHLLVQNEVDIKHVSEGHAGITDEEVIEFSKKESRVIITFDSDYGELVFKKGLKPEGVIYLRMKSFNPTSPEELILSLLKDSVISFESKFTVVDENQIRQRDIPNHI